MKEEEHSQKQKKKEQARLLLEQFNDSKLKELQKRKEENLLK